MTKKYLLYFKTSDSGGLRQLLTWDELMNHKAAFNCEREPDEITVIDTDKK